MTTTATYKTFRTKAAQAVADAILALPAGHYDTYEVVAKLKPIEGLLDHYKAGEVQGVRQILYAMADAGMVRRYQPEGYIRKNAHFEIFPAPAEPKPPLQEAMEKQQIIQIKTAIMDNLDEFAALVAKLVG